jgi:hypothetical protein
VPTCELAASQIYGAEEIMEQMHKRMEPKFLFAFMHFAGFKVSLGSLSSHHDGMTHWPALCKDMRVAGYQILSPGPNLSLPLLDC